MTDPIPPTPSDADIVAAYDAISAGGFSHEEALRLTADRLGVSDVQVKDAVLASLFNWGAG
jgi:hypothetical protein